MNENQEQLAFHHQIGVALSQWQNNVEIQLYNIKQVCTGDQHSADTYIALFTHRNFRFRLKEVNDLVLAKFTNTPHLANWLSLHDRIETAEERQERFGSSLGVGLPERQARSSLVPQSAPRQNETGITPKTSTRIALRQRNFGT